MFMTQKLIRFIMLAAVGCLLFPTFVCAETTSFDDLSEGVIGNSFTDNGITFFNLTSGQPGLESVFVIEQADGGLVDQDFSTPNGLTANSYTSGSGAGFGSIKEMSLSTEADADAASIDFFTTAPLLSHNTITLEAIKDGVVVESASEIIDEEGDAHFSLTIDGVTFDTLRVVSSPNPQVLILDNVSISTIVIDPCECDIEPDGVCDMNDWRLFGEDWGRVDCLDSPDICECDLTQDGTCDMNDYRLFGQDWGRVDCPVVPVE